MVLSVQNLRVQYGARVLFNDLSFTVEDGERIALAGHNGAGKSTLMKCIAGLNEPDSGSIIKSRHSQVGYLPQEGIHIRGRRLIDEAMSAFADLMDLQERIDVLTREMAGLDPRSAAYSEVLNESGNWNWCCMPIIPPGCVPGRNPSCADWDSKTGILTGIAENFPAAGKCASH